MHPRSSCHRLVTVLRDIYDGGHITSDSGGLLLREIEEGQRFIQRFSQYFTDLRNPTFIEHSVYELVSQRTYGLCLGNEDLNDHDLLRADPLLALLCGKQDLEGKNAKECSEIAASPWRERARSTAWKPPVAS